MTAAESIQVIPERPSDHFTWDEFACSDMLLHIYPLDWRLSRGIPLAVELERVRARIGAFRPTSVYRTWLHHVAIYDAMRPKKTAPAASQHLFGRAADVPCGEALEWHRFVQHVLDAAHEPASTIRYLQFYPSQRFVHLDCRQRKILAVEGL